MIFAGPLRPGSTSLSRLNTFRSLGCEVHPVDYTPFCEEGPRLLRAVERRVKFGPGIWKLNRSFEEEVNSFKPQLVWVEKALGLWPSTVENITAPMVHYSPDDYLGKGLFQELILRSLRSYAVVLTTKTFNVSELLQRGARKCHYVGNAFDPEIHRPHVLPAAEKSRLGADVCFLGRWEPDREETLARLAEAGMRLRVWGRDWARRRLPKALRPCVVPNGAYGDDYAKVISASKIVLNILSKWYRDEETTRSIEIPACCGFMLAERTPKHLEYFVEGQEAEFYATFPELLEKVRFYLRAEERRLDIARAGYERCLRSGYSYRDRLTSVLEYLERQGVVPAGTVPKGVRS